MEVVNYTEFRKNMKANLDLVSDENETIIIARSEKRNVVMLSLEKYNEMNATMYLTSTENNRKRLDESIKQLKQGKIITKKLSDLV